MEQTRFNFSQIQYVFYVAARCAVFDRAILSIYLAHRGMSEDQAGILVGLISISILLLDIPAGFISDRIGRTSVVFAGLVLITLHPVMLLMSDSFAIFALAFLLLGAGTSLISNSDHSLIYERLREANRQADFIKLEAYARAVGGLTLSAAIVLGGYFAQKDFLFVYYAYFSASFLALVFWFLIWANDSEVSRPATRKANTSVGLAMEAAKYLAGSMEGRSFLTVAIAVAVIAGCFAPLYFFGSIKLYELNISLFAVGLIYALFEIAASLMFLSAEWVEKRLTISRIVACGLGLMTFAVICSAFGGVLMTCLGLGLAISFRPLFDILTMHFMHRKIPQSVRTTGLSISTSLSTGCIGLGYFLYSAISHFVPKSITQLFFGLILILLSISLLVITRYGTSLRPYSLVRSY